MLTESSYHWALLVYQLSAVLALVLMNVWLLSRHSAALRIFLTLPVAALLLTPAYIEAQAETMAPALVVAAFQWLSVDQEAAMHAIRPLVLFTAVAFVLGLIVAVFLIWRKKRPDPALDLAQPD